MGVNSRIKAIEREINRHIAARSGKARMTILVRRLTDPADFEENMESILGSMLKLGREQYGSIRQ